MASLTAARRQRALWSRSKVATINALRLFWIFVVLWCELGAFHWSVAQCRWPDGSFAKSPAGEKPFHVLLITDPQVPRPYRGWLPGIAWLKQYVVNLNLCKSWKAVKKLRPEAVIFVGDMLRHGRSVNDLNDYGEYYELFQSIFNLDPMVPKYYVPGNRDVGLGSSRTFSVRARDRFEAYFGPINQLAVLGNHTFVLLDAPGLVEEDYRRHGAQVRFADWLGVKGGSIDFVKSVAASPPDGPVILISHIPLFRPDAALCGPFREHGNIRRGVGRGYQNLLGRDTSNFVLESTRPSVIFSGDDHDYCEYLHPASAHNFRETREVTVKAFSMATRVGRPGLQLLSLLALPETQSGITHADLPCLLPNQSRIYNYVYAPLILITVLFLLLSNARRPRPPRLQGTNAWHDPVPLQLRDSDSSDSTGAPSPPASPIHFKSSRSQPSGLRSASTHIPNAAPSQPVTPLGGTPLLSSTFRPLAEDEDSQDLLYPGHFSTPRFPLRSPKNDSHATDSSYFLPSPGVRKVAVSNKETWLPSFSTRTRLTVDSGYVSAILTPFLVARRISLIFGQRRARTWFGRFLQDTLRVALPSILVYSGISLWLFH